MKHPKILQSFLTTPSIIINNSDNISLLNFTPPYPVHFDVTI